MAIKALTTTTVWCHLEYIDQTQYVHTLITNTTTAIASKLKAGSAILTEHECTYLIGLE